MVSPEHISSEQVVELFKPLYTEQLLRAVRSSKLEVIANPLAGEHKRGSFGAPGTVTIFLARRGAGVLDKVRVAIASGGSHVKALVEHWQRQVGERKKVSVAEGLRQIIAESVFAELRYGGSQLVNVIAVPDRLDCVPLVLPYNGGRFAAEGFQLIEYVREGSEEGLEAIVLETAPPLTEAEKVAIEKVPASQLVQNVGKNLDCETTGVAVAWVVAVVVLLVVALATSGCALEKDTHLSEEELSSLGPAASARKILQLRRSILLQQAQVS